MKHNLIFIGECRSPTAQRKGWTWKDGRLAAKPLFEALAAMGVDPSEQRYYNLFHDPTARHPDRRTVNVALVVDLRALRGRGFTLVALGARVSAELARRDVDHVAIVHPAARGRIRKRERYIAHVAEKLTPAMKEQSRITQAEIDARRPRGGRR